MERDERLGHNSDVLGSLERLSKLHSDGLLTDSEFQHLKGQLIVNDQELTDRDCQSFNAGQEAPQINMKGGPRGTGRIQMKARPAIQIGVVVLELCLLWSLLATDVLSTEWHLGTISSPIIIPTFVTVSVFLLSMVSVLHPLYVTYVAKWWIAVDENKITLRHGLLPNTRSFLKKDVKVSILTSDSRVLAALGLNEAIQIRSGGEQFRLPCQLFPAIEFEALKKALGLGC